MEPQNLYAAIQEAVDQEQELNIFPDGLNISTVMSTWDSLPGYPVINVDRDYATGAVTFSQVRE